MLGLVVEGGANRTYYSIGVLDALLDNGISSDFLVGVSAGIANAMSYISKQRGRSLDIGLKFVPDKNYMGFKHFFKKGNGSYYNRDFVFNKIPNELMPFDYETYDSWDGEAYAVVTNLDTGKPEYIKISTEDREWKTVQASCALPFMFKPIVIGNNRYFDGGCTDPLPVKFAYDKGCDKVITILTREETYKKEKETDVELSSFFYRKNKEFAAAMKDRSTVYNESRSFVHQKQKEGSAFVFAPKSTKGWKRTEKSTEALKKMYDEGYNDAVRRMYDLKMFIKK